MSPEPNLLMIVLGVLLLGGGLLIGLALGRASSKAERRARELERELAAAQSEHSAYRDEVSAHFGRASVLFRDMTRQYRAVYEHLADGARTLCPDKTDVLPAGGPEALLLGTAGRAAGGVGAASADAAGGAAAVLEAADADGSERAETADLALALAPLKEAVTPTLVAQHSGAVEPEELETDPLPEEAPPLGSPIRH